MIPQTLFFKIYPCCIPVKGFGRSIIYDLNRSVFSYIPNSLFELLQDCEGQTISTIKESIDQENWKVLDKYFVFLQDNEYILFCKTEEELKQFPAIELSYEAPCGISNAILQIKDELKVNVPNLIVDLSALGCRFIQVVFHGEGDFNLVSKVLSYFDKSAFRSVEVLVKYNVHFSESMLSQLVNKYRRIHHLIVYNSPQNRILKNFHFGMQAISYNTRMIDYSLKRSRIDASDFRPNIDLFCESQGFHTYFNQKVVIDIQGNIKNVPNTDHSFGNVNNVSLAEVIQTEEFQALWCLKKDDIEICKECEYRHMCVDNRIPERIGSQWKHNEKCNYDVYNCLWNHN